MKKYKITVIIPIFNLEKTIYKSVSLLKKQSVGFNNLEIIIINDGSNDGSKEICKRLAEKYENIICINQENRGVSSARNAGLKIATGKYIFFLDADDMLERHTIKNVSVFFDLVYNEVDMVTYPIETIYRGKKLKPHFRYQYLKEDGIYDLCENPYIGQTTMNIVVKNQFSENIFFDENQSFSEDQKYCCDVLKSKLKMGFCKGGRYIYYRSEESSSGRMAGACYIFEQCMHFFEELFAQYIEVPVAFQGLYVNDVYWKMCSNILFPYHYEEKQYKISVGRIQNLLQKCDNNVILHHPQIDFFEKYYLLRLKNKDSLKCVLTREYFGLKDNGNLVISERSMEIVITKFRIQNKHIEILGFIKSVFFQFWNDEVILCAIENDRELTRRLTLFESSHNYYQSHEKTQKFKAFRYRVPLKDSKKVRFEVGFHGIWFPTHFYFMPQIPLSHKYKRYEVNYQGCFIKLTMKNELCFSEVLNPATYRVWLYYDCVGVRRDNGYLQFIHDIKKKDGVKRFYIVTDERQAMDKRYKNFFVKFGSRRHKYLLKKCEKLLTAYIEESNIFPYTSDEIAKYANTFQFETIYLQHGVFHIIMPWKFSPEKIRADKIVVSTKEEKKLFVNNGFNENDLYCVGMARFEQLDKSKPKKKKILFAPSWREYLTGQYRDHRWELLKEKCINSSYFQQIQKFINSSKLDEILRKSGYQLDIKLHPIFSDFQSILTAKSSYINLITDIDTEEDYSLFITDFSSFMYDFIYLNTCIINFIPDIIEFKCGMNGYRELNYTEDFWDSVIYNSEDLVLEIEKFIQGKRHYFQHAHFFNIEDCCQRLYEKIYTN